MSDSKLARRGKQAAGLLAGAALFGGAVGVLGASPSSAMMTPKTPVDLSATVTSDVGAAISRTTTFHDTATLSNLSASDAPGTLAITVTGSPTASLTSDAGLTCGPQVPTSTGFTISCATDSELDAGTSLSAHLTLTPSTDPKLHVIGVKAVAKLVNGTPATFVDPISTNNISPKVVSRVGDVADIRADVFGDSSVLRTDIYQGYARIKNQGPNPVYGRVTLTVTDGSDFSISPPLGVTCAGSVPILGGTGYTRSCTTDAPIPSGSSVDVLFEVEPSATAKSMKMTVVATKVGGMTVDPILTNNKISQTVLIFEHVVGTG